MPSVFFALFAIFAVKLGPVQLGPGGIHREARKARKEDWGQAAEGSERGNK
jgi:hypothetical protein